MADTSILNAEDLRETLSYDPLTGVFRWLKSKQGRRPKVGSIDREGYLKIKINYRDYRAGPLAWLWVTGEWPTQEIDHINNDPLDNRWVNLRLATRHQQTWNRRKRRGARYGYVGIRRTPEGAWAAVISRTFLGNFDTAEEAAEAYRQAAIARYGKYVNGGLLSDTGVEPLRRRDRRRRDNTSGFTGARQLPSGRWRARLGARHLGTFATAEEAHEAYLKAKLIAQLRHTAIGSTED